MASTQGSRFFTLLQREFREYKTSMFWTPILAAVLMLVLMLGSIMLGNRFGLFDFIMGSPLFDGGPTLSVGLSMGDGGEGEQSRIVVLSGDGDVADSEAMAIPPEPPGAPSYRVIEEGDGVEEQWNFSREWVFEPQGDNGDEEAADSEEDGDAHGWHGDGNELNAVLSVVHGILLMVLFIITASYLLTTLYDDRKDRSILFWRSMPVSEWDVVLSKFVMALVVAPLIYIAVSLVLQLGFILLMMFMTVRMGEDPFVYVLGNIDFVAAMLHPITGWVLTALWIAPLYAYLLLVSSAARRSPLVLAIGPVVALLIAEGALFGSEVIGDSIQNHVPHATEGSAVGFYLFGPDWGSIDLTNMAAGLLFAAAALFAAVWLRRNRWEL